MKIIAVLLLASLMIVAGCGKNGSLNRTKCRQSVVVEVGTTDVINVPDKSYSFIARDKNGAVWYVETMSSSGPEVTAKTMIFGPIK